LPTVDDILNAVADETGVPREELVGSGRRRADALLAREAVVWLLRRVRCMESSQVSQALDMPFRTVDAIWRRLLDETDERGGRRIALATAARLAERGVDAWPNPPSVQRVMEVVAAFAQEPIAGLTRRRGAGQEWSVGRKALLFALLDGCRMKRHAAALAMNCHRTSVQWIVVREASAPNDTDISARRIADAAVASLRREALYTARSAA
jgi:hypothetical protein